ncbi:hypothetical protein MYX65_00265, partial [Acidobacteria bacterium AH-259-L09]|nr:hypothetical protein [Acidobacteria bacterium AH-259-L09]
EASDRGINDYRFKVDWKSLGLWLADKATRVVEAHHSFEGVIIYASYNPRTPEGKGFNKWAVNWLGRQPSIKAK